MKTYTLEQIMKAIDDHADGVIKQIEKQYPIIDYESPIDVTAKVLQISKVRQGLDNIKKSITDKLSTPELTDQEEER